MGLLDRFKKSKPEAKKEEIKKPSVKSESKVKVQKQKAEKPKIEKPKSAKKIIKKEYSEAWRILKTPLITEKAAGLNNFNQYVFKVFDDTNKAEVKKAIQDFYGVQVLSVNIINSPGKKRRLGRHEGWRPGYKKAIITLAEGEKIEAIAR